MAAEIVGKEKVLLQQQKVGFDIEKAKSDGPSIQGFKSQGHVKGLREWTFDRCARNLYIQKLVIILDLTLSDAILP
jgi:hypothetical protein